MLRAEKGKEEPERACAVREKVGGRGLLRARKAGLGLRGMRLVAGTKDSEVLVKSGPPGVGGGG